MKEDPRMAEVLDLIHQLANGNLQVRGTITGKGDELDDIIAGLNHMVEELAARQFSGDRAEQRMDELMEVVISIAALDYTKKAHVSDAGDIFDALGAGLNALSEELLDTTVSRDFLNNVIQSMTDTLIVINPEKTIQSVNRALLDLLGYNEEELIGKPLGQLFPKEGFKKLGFDKLANSGNGQNVETYYLSKDNRPVPVAFNSSILRNDAGEIQGIVCVARDITARKLAEEALRESEAKTRAILATVPDLIFQIDKDGVFLEYHAAREELYTSPEQFLGKKVNEVLPEALAKTTLKNIKSALRTDEVQVFDYSLQMNGHIRYYEARMVRSTENSVLTIMRDITDRKKTEIQLESRNKEHQDINEKLRNINVELRSAKEKAEESDRLKTAFLANISHEIRTPMNAIIGFSDLLLNMELATNERQQYMHIINAKSRELLNLLTDLIDTSRIEAGDLKTSIHPIEVNPFLENIVNGFKEERQMFEKSQIIIRLRNPKDTNPVCYSDRFRLTQVFNNLLTNALKFTYEGFIEVGYTLKNGRIIFYVKDSGIGIPEDKITVIFERFRQVDDSINSPHGGTGLGLSISKHIVEILGGEMWVESAEKQGSTFYISLPISDESKATVPKESSSESSSVIPALDLSQKTILIAEDDSSNYLFIESLLRGTQAELIWARNGQQAVDIHQKMNGPDLILMDIRMPEKDGLEATKEIRKYDSEVPIIALTAFTSSVDHQRSLEAGCNSFLSKPVNLGALILTIQKIDLSGYTYLKSL